MYSLPSNVEDYKRLDALKDEISPIEWAHILRELCRKDLYALIRYVLSVKDWKHPETGICVWEDPWLFDRCREAQFDNNNVLDIRSRGYYKSTIKTFAVLFTR